MCSMVEILEAESGLVIGLLDYQIKRMSVFKRTTQTQELIYIVYNNGTTHKRFCVLISSLLKLTYDTENVGGKKD